MSRPDRPSAPPSSREKAPAEASAAGLKPLPATEAEWKARLTPEQYRVMREKGTERAFTGKYEDFHEDGVYHCAACGAVLFRSDSKFDSGCGWPAFDKVADKTAVDEHVDKTFGMVRTEVTCHRCGAHLGHVFDDGPTPTGVRYCINSVSIEHEPTTKDGASAEGKPGEGKAGGTK